MNQKKTTPKKLGVGHHPNCRIKSEIFNLLYLIAILWRREGNKFGA